VHHAASTRARPRREESGLRRGPRGGTCRVRSDRRRISQGPGARGCFVFPRVSPHLCARARARGMARGVASSRSYPRLATADVHRGLAATVRRRRYY
jgi:hypothetical protein